MLLFFWIVAIITGIIGAEMLLQAGDRGDTLTAGIVLFVSFLVFIACIRESHR